MYEENNRIARSDESGPQGWKGGNKGKEDLYNINDPTCTKIGNRNE